MCRSGPPVGPPRCDTGRVARLEIDPDASRVWIDGSSSVHPIRARAHGLTGWVEVALDGGAVAEEPGLGGEVRIEVGRLASGNPLVDRETRRRIDARRFPEIVGTVTAADRVDDRTLAVTGDIAFRGEVRPVAGELDLVVGGAGRLTIEGSVALDVRDWGLTPPRVGLLRVHPDIEVRIHVEAVPPGH